MNELKEVMNVMQVSGERIPSGYYKKSEADKVIAEKDKELRHQKYKRCLNKADYWGLVGACTHGLIQLKCMRREMKWRKLAEKLKEAK